MTRYAERGWTNDGREEEGEEEGNQEEGNQKEVVFIWRSVMGPAGGLNGPRLFHRFYHFFSPVIKNLRFSITSS
jgi:hypothetical protein